MFYKVTVLFTKFKAENTQGKPGVFGAVPARGVADMLRRADRPDPPSVPESLDSGPRAGGRAERVRGEVSDKG